MGDPDQDPETEIVEVENINQSVEDHYLSLVTTLCLTISQFAHCMSKHRQSELNLSYLGDKQGML